MDEHSTQESATKPSPPQPAPTDQAKPSRWPWLLALVMIFLSLLSMLVLNDKELFPPSPPESAPAPPPTASAPVRQAPPPPLPSPQGQVVPVAPVEEQKPDSPQAQEQAQRKEPFGLDRSLDAVARSDETLQIGDQRVPVSELERKLAVQQRRGLLETSLDKPGPVTAWGVHLVRPGENLWQIHYRLLREHLASRGIQLPPDADRPSPQGRSSGVGKVLKFAENMVGVYQLKSGSMGHSLDHLEPGAKAVVYNLSEIFEQLARMEPKDLDGLLYDGRVLLFPKMTSPAPPAAAATAKP